MKSWNELREQLKKANEDYEAAKALTVAEARSGAMAVALKKIERAELECIRKFDRERRSMMN